MKVKRLVTLLMAVLMLAGSFTVPAFAEDEIMPRVRMCPECKSEVTIRRTYGEWSKPGTIVNCTHGLVYAYDLYYQRTITEYYSCSCGAIQTEPTKRIQSRYDCQGSYA